LTAKARAERQCVWPLRCDPAFLLILLPPLKGSDYVCSIDPRAEPVRYATLAAFNLYPVGGKPVPRSLLQQCEGTQGSKGDGTLLESGHIAATWVHGHTSPWNQ
jgi:hypothetical protein